MPDFDWDSQFAGLIESEELDRLLEQEMREEVCEESGHDYGIIVASDIDVGLTMHTFIVGNLIYILSDSAGTWASQSGGSFVVAYPENHRCAGAAKVFAGRVQAWLAIQD